MRVKKLFHNQNNIIQMPLEKADLCTLSAQELHTRESG
jgi:hypothetical protein